MSNVLGNLFGEIANAIRAKTGSTDTMKPAEFPTQIAAIPTGGGGGNAGEWVMATGEFTAAASVETVAHGLGVVPDIAFIAMQMTGSVEGTSGAVLMSAIGFSQKFENNTALVEGNNPNWGAIFSLNTTMSPPGVTSGVSSAAFIDMPESASAHPIHSANANTIGFGDAWFPLHKSTYAWCVMARK